MKIAIISDIHGNIYALNEVLKDICKNDCEYILCLGDYVNYYYWPNEVLDALKKQKNIFFIKGNHEDMLFQALQNNDYKQKVKKRYGAGMEIAIDTISADNMEFLYNMKASQMLDIDNLKIAMFHGSPNANDQYIYPDISLNELDDIVKENFNIILLGHSHYQFSINHKHCLIINPGSVGQARDIRGLASYTILNTKNKAIINRRLKYDTSPIMQKIIDIEHDYKNMLDKLC
jgi:putative phosphoesterase